MTYQKNQDNIAIIQLKLKDQNPDFLIQGYNEGSYQLYRPWKRPRFG